MFTGTVKWFHNQRRQGLIRRDRDDTTFLITPDLMRVVGVAKLDPGEIVHFRTSVDADGREQVDHLWRPGPVSRMSRFGGFLPERVSRVFSAP